MKTAEGKGRGMPVLAARTLRLEGDVHKLVTFLNQALKGKGLTFGISKHPEGVQLSIYLAEKSLAEKSEDGG